MAQHNRRLLLIAPSFFGYANEIRKKLEQNGFAVWQYDQLPAVDNTTKAIFRLAPWLGRARADKYYDRIAAELAGQAISHVLVIKGEALSVRSIRKLRAVFNEAKFVLYFWDSYLNMPRDSFSKVSLFDRAFTFDPDDAKLDPRLAYRPLFYLDEYLDLPGEPHTIDVLFVGTAHTDRYAVVSKLSKSIPPELNFKKVLYLPSRWIFRIRKIFDPSFWRSRSAEFVFASVTKSEMLGLIAQSRIIVDIERSVQHGLTMRTIEMLGAGKKMISTNANVTACDFYNPANIAVIDRRNPVLSEQFLSAEYVEPAPAMLERYSLSAWVKEVVIES